MKHDDASRPASGYAWGRSLTEEIGRQVRRIRDSKGISAQKLSDLIQEQTGEKVTRNAIANLENARRDTVTIQELQAIAIVLEVPLTELYGSGAGFDLVGRAYALLGELETTERELFAAVHAYMLRIGLVNRIGQILKGTNTDGFERYVRVSLKKCMENVFQALESAETPQQIVNRGTEDYLSRFDDFGRPLDELDDRKRFEKTMARFDDPNGA